MYIHGYGTRESERLQEQADADDGACCYCFFQGVARG
jgi:hypothetical protein